MPSVITRRIVWTFTLILMTLSLATCITAEEHDYLTYDAAKDEFQMLMVLQDIRAKDAEDLAYLQAIYNNRDHLIAPALPGGANVIGMIPFSFLRLGDTQFAPLNIYGSRPSAVEPVDTTIPLASIKITPGTFFLQDKKLGYYQAITVPGKTIDAALLEISKALQTENMVKTIQTEIDRRAAGGKTATWAQVTAEMLKGIEIKPDAPATNEAPATAAATEAAAVEPQMALDLESLKALQQAVSGKALRLARNKQSVTLTLPLTARDSAAVAELYKAFVARMDEVIKNTKETPEIAEQLQQARATQQVARALAVSAGDKGVTAVLDLPAMAKSIAAMPVKRIDLNDKSDAAKEAPDAVKFIRDQKLPLNETLTAEQIVKDFTAGTLKAYPSDKPVKPGEDLVAKPIP